MSRRISGKLLYAATFVTLLALITGFVLASITINASTQNAQGNYVNAAGGVPGLVYTSTVLSAVIGAPTTTIGTGAAPVAVATGANSYCAAATCTAGDPAQVVTYTFTGGAGAWVAGTAVQINIVIGGTAISTTIYLKEPAAAVSGTIVIYGDLGTGTITFTATTLSVQLCTGAGTTCP
jgi:hypothetical protein